MAWTNPRTWVDTEIETASVLNQHIRDNLNALYPYTTKGDIAKMGDAGELTRLGVGTETQTLKSISEDLAYSSAIGFRVTHTTPISITNNTVTALTFDTVYYNTPSGLFNTSTNKLTIPANYGGLYLMGINGYFDAHASPGTLRQVGLNLSEYYWCSFVEDVNNQAIWVNMVMARTLSDANTAGAQVLQQSGATINFRYAGFWGFKVA
jgi:hypothetical protein